MSWIKILNWVFYICSCSMGIHKLSTKKLIFLLNYDLGFLIMIIIIIII